MENASDWEQKNLINEPTQGMELAKQLQIHLNVTTSPHETRELLVHKILNSYDKALLMLNLNGETQPTAEAMGMSESPRSRSGSPHSEDSDKDFKDHEHKHVSKKRKSMVRWTKQVQVYPGPGLEGCLDDGYNWRKYGQKDILGAKYPSCWSNPDKIDNIEHLRQMEDSLRESLNRIQIQKENFAKHPLMSLECTSQFQNGMHLPLMMGGMQEAPLSWLPDNENQHMLLTGDPNFLPQRDVECSTDHSLPTYSGYFGPGKTEIENTRQVDNTRQEGGALHGLDSTACLRLQLNEQYSYHPYSGLDLQETKKLRPETEMNLHGNPLNYQINSNFQLSRPIYDNMHHAWVPPSEPCSISMFNGNSYSQQPH